MEGSQEIRTWDRPEGLGLVAVFHHASHLTLEVDYTVRIGGVLADEVDDAFSVVFAWVFPLEDSIVVFSDHD